MGALVRLTNVDIQEFEKFYSTLSVSAQRLSREQMLEIADLLHDTIRERRGQEHNPATVGTLYAPLGGA